MGNERRMRGPAGRFRGNQAPDAHAVVFWDAGCGTRESDHQSLAIRQWQPVRQLVVMILTFQEGGLRTVGKGLRATRRSRLCVGVQGWERASVVGQGLTQALGEPKARQVSRGRERSQAVVRRLLSDVYWSVVSAWKGGRRVSKAASCPLWRATSSQKRQKNTGRSIRSEAGTKCGLDDAEDG